LVVVALDLDLVERLRQVGFIEAVVGSPSSDAGTA
jgi:hypothetical protein